MKRDKKPGLIGRLAKRYFIDALSAMALGLFSSLIIGLIIEQFGKIPGLGVLKDYAAAAQNGYVTGGAIAAAVAYGLKARPLAVFSSIAVGAFAYQQGGGPFGAYVAAVIGAEIGNLIAGKTKLDIVLVPIFCIIPGCIVGGFIGPYIGSAMTAIGNFIMKTTELSPIPMGILVSVVMGMVLTAPISSAAIAISFGLAGLAGGAAAAGCSANMVGFALASYRENRLGGLISQGLGTSMLQVGNIVRRPQIWLPAIIASAVVGPLSTAVFKMTCYAEGSGMGTSGLVGQFATYASMTDAGAEPVFVILSILLTHILLPAVIALAVSEVMRKLGWIKKGDMALKSAL